MKKTLLIIALIAFYIGANAQMNYQSAVSFFSQGLIEKARVEIDNCVKDADTKDMAKVWMKRGEIYLTIYTLNSWTSGLEKGLTKKDFKLVIDSSYIDGFIRNKKNENGVKMECWPFKYDMYVWLNDDNKVDSWKPPCDGDFVTIDYDALEIARTSLERAIKLEKEDELGNILHSNIRSCAINYQNIGTEAFKNEDYEKAFKYYKIQYDFTKSSGRPDYVGAFYAGYSAFLGKKTDDGIEALEPLINLGSNILKVQYIDHEKTYSLSTELYKIKGDTARALETIQNGRKIFPNSFSLLITECNIYLETEQTDKAIENLKIAVEQDPKNAELREAIGTQFFNNLDKIDSKLEPELYEETKKTAVNYLSSAIELDPKKEIALYNLGILYYNEGIRYDKIKNEYSYEEQDKQNKYKELSLQEWNKSIENLEKVYEINPSDTNIIKALRFLYYRTKQMDKYEEMNNLLK